MTTDNTSTEGGVPLERDKSNRSAGNIASTTDDSSTGGVALLPDLSVYNSDALSTQSRKDTTRDRTVAEYLESGDEAERLRIVRDIGGRK